jgi:hypothetical protein
MGVAAAAGMVVGVEAAFTVEAVAFMDLAGAVASMGLAAFTAEAVGFMDLVPMVAGLTSVMGGVAMALTFRLTAFMDMDLVATP